MQRYLFLYMSFYDLNKERRVELVNEIHATILSDISKGKNVSILRYASDEDTYIRKSAYLAIGKIYKADTGLVLNILTVLDKLMTNENEKVRQTIVNAAGEIGMSDFSVIEHIMEAGLFDGHHCVRNAVIGSIKKMGEKNPKPVLKFAKRYLHHEDKEIRREICHGIELRGRKYPQDILPLLRELQWDKTRRVRTTLVHVIGQIAYKKGCLETVIEDLRKWENQELVADAIEEIIDVHDRYSDFAVKTQEEAREYIQRNF